MLHSDFWVLLAMLIYFVVVLTIGFIYAKKSNQSTSNYFLGGRQLGPWLTALSAEASDMSGWLLMGLPGVAYFTGASDAVWTAIGLAIGTYVNWKIVAKRLRIYSEKAGDSITLPQYFANRFHDDRHIISTVAAIIIFLFFSIYVGSCFVTCGKLFSTLFGFDYATMMMLGAIIVFLYTFVGGYLSVCTTDLIQGTLMFFALAIVFIGSVANAGGVDNVVNVLRSIPGFLSATDIATPILDANGQQVIENGMPQFGDAAGYGAVTIISGLAWGLGYFGMPQVLVRFMSIRNPEEIKISRRIATIWCVISLSCAVCIGLVVSGIFAASMSSSSSYLLISGSSIAEDIFRGIIKRDATDRQVMIVARFVLLAVFIFGILLALDENSSIFGIVSYAWAGFGASFGPVILLSLYWKRMNLSGAIAGMITGTATVLIWHNFISGLGGWFAVYELLPGFVLALIVAAVVSLATKAPSDSMQKEFDEYQNAVAEMK